ncbi:MAG: PAS domain S-box protein [Alphaproteobacteria bacterium]|nr:PAS domain S-box protein [Alphaproteobacteria bacterium]
MASSASTDRAYPDILEQVGGLNLSSLQETAWIEVIRKMEEVYSDLIRHEIDLESKNEALEQAHRFIGSVLSSMSDVLLVCDGLCDIQQVNQALLDLTGYAEEELLGEPLTTLLPFADRNLIESLLGLSGAQPVQDREVRFLSKPGEPTGPVALNASLRRDSLGQPAGYVLIGRPVGELRRAYEALNAAHADLKAAQQQIVQSEKLASLGRLVAGVAHELNNPVSFVLGNLHSLARYLDKLSGYIDAVHEGASAKTREALRHELKIDAVMSDLVPLIEGTREGAERVAEIVRNLRRLSFTNPGGAEAFDLAQVARTAGEWAVRGRKTRTVLDFDLPNELIVPGNAGAIHQVLVNLVENALDALEEVASPRLKLSVRKEGAHAVAVVEDNGPGIAADSLLKLFDPFFTTKPPGRGTGLGLWISWNIVKDHGGAIEAGNHPDGGAVVLFTLPLAKKIKA